MKLKTYNEDNIRQANGGHKCSIPVLALNIKSGTMRFNILAVELLGLTNKSQVLIHNDEESPSDWYLEVVKKDGIQLRLKKTDGSKKELYFRSCLLAKEIVATVDDFKGSIPKSFKGGRLQIGQEPIKNSGRTLWPLLTGRMVTDLLKQSL